MANIAEDLKNIKSAILGRDVRASIHDGIDAINKDCTERLNRQDDKLTKQDTIIENNVARQDSLERKYDEQIKNIASSEPQNAEIVDARNGFDTLGKTLKQKIYHFSNVEEMKNCVNLVEGDVVETLGYYEENDGGGATYKIRLKEDADVEDGGSIHFLSNALVAELIISNVFVSSKQIGAIENNYLDIQKLYDIAKKYAVDICINGTYKVNTTVDCDKYIKIYGNGKLILDSYQPSTNDEVDYSPFIISGGGCISDLEFVSIADKIPRINKKAGFEIGYASNTCAVKINSSNCKIENIKTDFMTGVFMVGNSVNSMIDNINISNCYFNHAELAIFAQHASYCITDTCINMSTDVQSIYYHPFYCINIKNVIISDLNISTNDLVNPTDYITEYYINDVFHIFNPNSGKSEFDTYVSNNIKISNINISGLFNTLSTIKYHSKVIYSNINGTFKNSLFTISKYYKNIQLNNSVIHMNSIKTRTIDCTSEFANDDSIELNNTKIIYENSHSQLFGSCNLNLNNCKLIIPTGAVALPYNDSIANGYLRFNNCDFSISTISKLYLGLGEVEYKNCHFRNTYMASILDSTITEESKCKVINCHFDILRNLWNTQYQSENLFFTAYGYDSNTNKQKYISSIIQ